MKIILNNTAIKFKPSIPFYFEDGNTLINQVKMTLSMSRATYNYLKELNVEFAPFPKYLGAYFGNSEYRQAYYVNRTTGLRITPSPETYGGDLFGWFGVNSAKCPTDIKYLVEEDTSVNSGDTIYQTIRGFQLTEKCISDK